MAKQLTTGIWLRDRVLDWTTLRPRKGGAEIVAHEAVPLPLDPDAMPEPGSPDLVAALKKACSKVRGEVGLSVPTDQALLRVAELPSVDPDELEGMVELQIDKISPFPVEHMAVSYEILSQGETSTRVLIVAVRREIIDELGDEFRRAGHVPHGIDVDILGWWQLLHEAGRIAEHGRQILLLFDEHSSELVVTHDGIPVLFRSLGMGPELADEDIEELVDDVGYTLTTLEAEWGTAERVQLNLWSRNPMPADLTARLQHDLGVAVDVHGLEELPPLSEGLARRMARTQETRIDLSPAEWMERERTRHARLVLLALTLVFFSVWLGGITVFLAGLSLQQKELRRVQARSEEMNQVAEAARQAEEKVKSLEQYADRSRSALECLREVSVLLPQGIDLTSFSYRKGKSVKIRGESPNEGPIYDFIGAMEKSDLFAEAKSGDIARKRRKNRTVTEFTVTAQLPGDQS